MKNNQTRIEIVRSTSTGLSSLSQPSCDAIFRLLKLHYGDVRVTTVNNLADLKELAARNPDLVFMGMKFVPVNEALGQHDPDKIWVADFLDLHDIAFTGSNQSAHELELNKNLAKQRILDTGFATSAFTVIEKGDCEQEIGSELNYPLFVKPPNRGGGFGIDGDSVVHNNQQLRAKVNKLAKDHNTDSLVEEYLPGREFSVAILKDEFSDDVWAMPLELIAPINHTGARLLSAAVKSADAERAIEVTDLDLKQSVTDLALNVFSSLGARDYGRVDIRLDKNGVPHFLEANLIPSLIQGYGSFPKACVLNLDMNYQAMILHIVRLGLARNAEPYFTNIESLVPALST